MVDPSIERIENLIRVVRNIPNDKFDINQRYNLDTKCGCAIGYATKDPYFIARGFNPFTGIGGEILCQFFNIDPNQAVKLFTFHPGYSTRQDVINALRILLLERMAHESLSEANPNYAGADKCCS